MTKLKTKLRGGGSSSRRERDLKRAQSDGVPLPDDESLRLSRQVAEDALRFQRHTTLSSAMSDDVEEMFYGGHGGHGGAPGHAGVDRSTAGSVRATDVYRTTEQLRSTGLEPLAEDRVLPPARPAVPASSGPYADGPYADGPGGLAALRAELADVRAETQAIRREVMNELHVLRYDVLKEVTVLKGAVAQLLAALAPGGGDAGSRPGSAGSATSAATTASSSSAELSPADRAAIGVAPTVVASDATRARLAAARPDPATCTPTPAARASARLTQLAPVDDAALSAPLRPEQLDELFPLVDASADIAAFARARAPGTRDWATARVQEWLDSRFNVGQDTLLGVVGGPGTGKSTFCGSVCDMLQANVLATHFCKFDRKAKSTPRVVLLSLVRQVVANLPPFKRQLARLNLKYVLEEPDVFVLAGKVLIDPLAACEEPITAKCLVLDGLDQCKTVRRGGVRNELLEFLAHVVPQLPSWLGVLVASKPAPELATQLKFTSLLDFSAKNKLFVQDARFLVDDIAANFADAHAAEARRLLETKAGGNFAYLDFTRQALSSPGLDDGELELDMLHDLPESLYEIYLEIFEDKFGRGRNRLWGKVQPLLALIVAAAAGPYSLVREDAARELLGYSSDDMRLVKRSFVDIIAVRGGCYRIESSALFEWLSDPARGGESFFFDADAGVDELRRLQQHVAAKAKQQSDEADAQGHERRRMSRRESARSTASNSSSSTSSRSHSPPPARTSSRVSSRYEPPANPSKPVGILKRGRL